MTEFAPPSFETISKSNWGPETRSAKQSQRLADPFGGEVRRPFAASFHREEYLGSNPIHYGSCGPDSSEARFAQERKPSRGSSRWFVGPLRFEDALFFDQVAHSTIPCGEEKKGGGFWKLLRWSRSVRSQRIASSDSTHSRFPTRIGWKEFES